MNQDRNQPRYPSENREVRRPRHDFEGERYPGRGEGQRYEDGHQTSPRYGDQSEYSYGDDYGSESSYGSRYESQQRGGREDWNRGNSERYGSSYQSYDSDDNGRREASGPRYSYGAPGQGYGQSQGGSFGGSFGGSQGSYGAAGRGFGGRRYYGGQGQSQGQTQYGGGYAGGSQHDSGSSSYRGEGDSWGAQGYQGTGRPQHEFPGYGTSQQQSGGYASRQSRNWGNGGSEGAYGEGYRRGSPYSYQSSSGMLTSQSSTLYGPYTGKGPKNYRRSDQQIVEDANQALERHGEVDASEIEVTCNNGVVKLTGKVENRRAKREAEECVEQIYGVTDVMNELKVDKGFFANLFGTGSSSGSSSSASSSSQSASNDTSDDKSSSRSASSKPFQKNT
jgi:osmotically-inducible protein OsmY